MSIKNKIKNYFTMDDEYEYEYTEEVDGAGKPNVDQKNQNVVNLTSLQQPSSKVVLYEPRTYNEAQEIADNIVNRRAVVINLQRLESTQAKRVVDFLSGTVYAVNGDIQKLGSETFLCTPDNVDVSGTISESYVEEDEFEKGW
ncbi:cell division protein SepF [Virgibacillus sp. NKC19-3]|uniref:cell division protein SepF n=1 Tax=Virgibacillus saliphilus TaxID=2831674 RepID=UPI001C9AFC00|nr:cell division protein SepF [Virgibacillus sp. NKC19-3]MBY7143711.1 cell division protein SepF [Virgibacillus sp. NKC19-3]